MTKSLFIITGASKGIGKGLAVKALETGAKVWGINRTHSIEHENYEALTFDLANIPNLLRESPQLFSKAAHYEKIVLINNAGTLGDIGHLGNIENDSIPNLFDLNVSAPILLMNQFMKDFKDFAGEKIIINISSGAGKNAVDGWSGYCASKAALDMASKVAAKEAEMDGNGFIIKAIAPGVVDTEMQTQIRSTDKKSFSGVEKFKNLKAENQLSSEQEVAEKYFHFIDNLERYPDVILDVRDV
ncbi:benzil reductase ((S)-benzoin forming) [Marivirga tractuosa]|uniref:Short-chain dehydrogenase/reductase SDR n=1 Tax=Marivirga tractuosa (strain ATCC 23168 / DSM 4126 / NBRC 15989 / NCIMB 1408 / VKM B-1430 / H-43) TaxID=643867 RepID=E4TSJ2_MARTH|nr:SDR family NAD(P)-dependent oxidoreductase [Marivirga tractuosa]ADR20812.1 short-chain dehydrogenase/reductase SDR [Marivirga tractuosa DSM 4126]BDD14737.1 benzil reductase ((S)-benzoin forming) [Marivirga tractuosa]